MFESTKLTVTSSMKRVGKKKYEGESRRIPTSTADKARNNRNTIDATKFEVTRRNKTIKYKILKDNRVIYE